MPGVIQKSQFCRVRAVPKWKRCLGARRVLSPIVQLHATGVNALQTGYVLSRGCCIGSRGRRPIRVRFCGGVTYACTGAVEEPSRWAYKPLANPSWMPGSVFSTLVGQRGGILDNTRNPAQPLLTGGSHAAPVHKCSPHMKGFLSPWRPGSSSLLSALLLMQARMNIWGIPYLRIPSSIHGELPPLASSWMSSTMCEMMKRCNEINTDSTEDSNTSN